MRSFVHGMHGNWPDGCESSRVLDWCHCTPDKIKYDAPRPRHACVVDVVAGEDPAERNFRIGGLVVAGSVEREDGSLDMIFRVTDMRCELNVQYTGVLPDLFREGQGVVAHGRMGANDDVFVADKILAKHDENYMAPEVAESLAKHVEDKTASLRGGVAECETG